LYSSRQPAHFPDAAFTVNWTAFSIFIVMIGGIGTIEGPIIGVCCFYY